MILNLPTSFRDVMFCEFEHFQDVRSGDNTGMGRVVFELSIIVKSAAVVTVYKTRTVGPSV